MIARIELHRLERDSTPVAIVGARVRRPFVVDRRLYSSGDERVYAVSADDNTRLLRNRRATSRLPGHARHTITVPDQFLNSETLAQFGARVDGGVHKELIEHR